MKRVFAAPGAELGQLDFLGYVDLIFFRYVILGFTDRARKTKNLSGTFFCHARILPYYPDPGKAADLNCELNSLFDRGHGCHG